MSSIIEFPTPKDLTGRILSLNLQVCRAFSCGGFSVGPNNPFAVVGERAQQDRLHQALLDGRLVDISDQNIRGIVMAGSSHSPAKVLDEKGKKVYLQINQDGSLTVVAPASEEEEARREIELAEKGILSINEDEVQISSTTFNQSGKVDHSAAEQIITNMATALDKARSSK